MSGKQVPLIVVVKPSPGCHVISVIEVCHASFQWLDYACSLEGSCEVSHDKRESKSQPGRYYYVSPAGQTQWFPPRRVTVTRSFNWRCEIEIEFGPGRLGVNLKEVPQTTNIPFAMFQAEVEELPKLPGGKPGPAEIYNWSVRPERRLYQNMRLTQVDGVALAGCKYTEVVEKLKRAARPVKLKVCRCLLGEGETSALDAAPTSSSSAHPTASSTAIAPSSAPLSAYSVQKQKKEEYMNLLVTTELSNEMWRLETQKVQWTYRQLRFKWNLLSASLSGLLEAQVKAKKQIEAAMADKAKYDEMLVHLHKQETGLIVSPEVQRTNDLGAKNAELTQDIGHMTAGNKKLRRERDANQRHLDELDAQLVHGLTQAIPDSLVGVVDDSMSTEVKLAVVRQRVAAMEMEMRKEEAKTRQADVELAQLSKVYNQQTEVILESSRGGMSVSPGMLKSMRLMRGARERWCQLHASGSLVYYKKRGDPVPRGEIALTDPTLEVVCEALLNGSSKKPPKELVFTVSTTQAQNRFQANTMDELREWVTAILTFHSGWMNTRV
ncbi:hypothetical protein DYB25_003419 [Aphanomyces astaci]|uniref:PH domain-containing protein n=1 Tax=Aphanomyces astaci TaxID=112090 RepID=A0A397AV90_APHAT|nr:hypothetical protein DYB25_003419 [Aphanomyces astaci]